MLKHKYNFSRLLTSCLCSVKMSTPKHSFPTLQYHVYTFSQEISNWLVQHTAE
jgi:hypothetical protein